MNFFKQIISEAKHMLSSKFILISALVIMFIICAVGPVLTYVTENLLSSGGYYGGGYSVSIGPNGEIYESYGSSYSSEGTQLTWELEYLNDEIGRLNNEGEAYFENADSVKYAIELTDELITFFTAADNVIKSDEDYRMNSVYSLRNTVADNYVLEFLLSGEEYDEDVFTQAMEYSGGYNYQVFKDLTTAELQETYDKNITKLNLFYEMLETNDFAVYVELKKISYTDDIEHYKEQIETMEENIIKDPSQEEFLAENIEYLELNIRQIETSDIPELDYRLEHNIIPGDGSWQDSALDSKSRSESDIEYLTTVGRLTEEEFYEDQYSSNQYDSYQDYINSLDKQVVDAEYDLLVAQSSLEADKPDMKFVDGSSRAQVNGVLSSSMLIGIFGILVGGYSIATEFQSGTVRLLMIRPRLRLKVIISRFIAGLALTYILYFLIFFVMILVKGFTHGFDDYMYPNYTASGEVNFFIMLLERMMISSLSILFSYVLAFATSAIIKNIAVAIIVPTIVLMGSSIAMAFILGLGNVEFLAFTPIPYMAMSDFFAEYSMITSLIANGMPLSLGLGAAVLLIYGAILFAISLFTFKKHDITN